MCWMDDECQTEPSLASNTQAAGTQITNRVHVQREHGVYMSDVLSDAAVLLCAHS